MKIVYLRADEEKEKSNSQEKDTDVELEQIEQMRLVDWLVCQ